MIEPIDPPPGWNGESTATPIELFLTLELPLVIDREENLYLNLLLLTNCFRIGSILIFRLLDLTSGPREALFHGKNNTRVILSKFNILKKMGGGQN